VSDNSIALKTGRTGFARRFIARLCLSVPSLTHALVGALLWGTLMGASALTNLLWDAWETTGQIRFVSMIYVVGGFFAFPLGLFVAKFIAIGRSGETAFAAAFLGFAFATVAVTAMVYAVQYRTYYAEWHSPTFSILWFFQLVFTAFVSFYQFAVLGLRLFFPLGFVALFAASLWFARLPR
jgi:hypothetical protein